MATSLVSQSTLALRWDLLEEQAPTGERLTARLAAPDVRDDVFIAVDAECQRYVLVGVPQGEPHELAERTSKGIAVQTVDMNIGEGERSFFVEVACLEAQGHAALDVVVRELVQALNAGASIGRVRLVQNILAKWRRFWSGVDQGVLSREQQIGLFGELWFLSRWLTPCVGPARATGLWRGPGGARNDFETPGLGIEVKTTGRQDAAYSIHGLEQLLEPSGGALLLFCLAVRDESSGVESLPQLVAELREQRLQDFTALSMLDSMLYASGYDDQHSMEYAKLRLRVRSEGLYRVQPGFPRLVPAAIVDGVPPGVTTVNYELHLDAAAPWLVAAAPSAAMLLLSDFIER
ncbi:PD-(D/E)XK motif protein [Achromobacter sp. Marseille-Q0513]|uniref:PD-(D/E)XK motif protein n=1 Tax=Achromobacter sp. Marseille-Q0513 TaxID=2829161 RepID=UPI001B9C9EA5|nr:PD-(D/E)XK motif protein [Achromobacter sp. Marseille-Q0513]MBR8653157.1 PD-(D/E)XK motif protein [Achromobacter sp. Marseille-Q0513]